MPSCDMRTRGYPHTFKARPWGEIASFLDEMTAKSDAFSHMSAVAHSVIDCRRTHDLAGTTSMHDIVVTSTPLGEPPHEIVIVRSPSSVRRPSTGHVAIEHQSLTGHDDSIERPTSEAVPLFWRFMIEKFGVAPH